MTRTITNLQTGEIQTGAPYSPEELVANAAALAEAQASAAIAAAAKAEEDKKTESLDEYKNSIRREADALEKQGLFVESFLKLKTIGE